MRRALLMASMCLLATAACSGGGEPSSHASPTSGSSPTAGASPAASPPASTPVSPTSSGQACGDPRAHVYNPDRLKLLAACVTVTGTIQAIRSEADGDVHILLKLDPGQEQYVNSINMSELLGDLVLEPVCVRAPTQADAVGACAGYRNPLVIPAVGTHVSVTGAWVVDLHHGWQEIHPVFAFS